MQKLRSRITKVVVISLLWGGFGLYLAQPVEAQSSSKAFADWMSDLVRESGSGDLQRDLDKLDSSGIEIHQLMEYASVVISQKKNSFILSQQSEVSSRQVFHLLLVEWDQSQTGKGMARVPVPRTLKPVSNLQLDKIGKTVGDTSVYKDDILFEQYTGAEILNPLRRDASLIPMAESIAIGAP